jgi:hypothetical protein
MRRRDFITVLGGVAVCPEAAWGQQQAVKLPTIGFLGASTSSRRAKHRSQSGVSDRQQGWRAPCRWTDVPLPAPRRYDAAELEHVAHVTDNEIHVGGDI